MASYQTPQDEGYSEDPLTMQLSGATRRTVMEAEVQEWLSDLPVPERARKSTSRYRGRLAVEALLTFL
jgi:hypothetical protein